MEVQNVQPAPQEAPEPPKRHSLLFIVSIFLLLGAVAFSVYLTMQKSTLESEQARMSEDVATLKGKISEFKTQDIEAEQSAKKYLEELSKTEIRWSSVLKSLQELIPTDASKRPLISFTSYAGSAGGKLSLNGQTRSGSTPPYDDVSQLLELFNNNSFFKDAFVPSTTVGTSNTGDAFVNFPFQVTYHEEFPVTNQVLPIITPPNTPEVVPSSVPVSTNPETSVSTPAPTDSEVENPDKIKRQ